MKILSRYLFKNLLMPLVYLLAAFTMLFIIGDLMDHAGDFLDAGTSLLEMAYYYALRLPSMVIMIVPLCLLLAVLYSLSSLTRHSEIIAMRASGISIYRIVRPYLLMSIACLILTAVVNEYTGPKFAYRADQFVEQQTHAGENVYYERIASKNPTFGTDWQVAQFDMLTYDMNDVKFTQYNAQGKKIRGIHADKARWMDGRWWFIDGTIQAYDALENPDGAAETFSTKEMRGLQETPEYFIIEIKYGKEESSGKIYMSSVDRWKFIQMHQHLSPASLTKNRVNFHHTLTMPFVCIIITMIGIPVGAHTGRKGAFSGIMLALGMFFSFYALLFTLEYLAKQMILDPWIGTWGALIAFFFIGSVMIHRMR